MVLCLQLPLVATLETGKQRTGAESSHGKLVLDAASDGSLRQVATLPLGWDVICDYSSPTDHDAVQERWELFRDVTDTSDIIALIEQYTD